MSSIDYLWAARFACLALACILNVFSTLVICRSRYRLFDSLPMKYVLAITMCQLIPNVLTLATSVIGILG